MKMRMLWMQLLLVLLATVVCHGSHDEEADNRTELYIAFITSFEGEFDSSVAVPAVHLAIDKVNEDESLLPDHQLVVELIDERSIAEDFANSKVWKLLIRVAYWELDATPITRSKGLPMNDDVTQSPWKQLHLILGCHILTIYL